MKHKPIKLARLFSALALAALLAGVPCTISPVIPGALAQQQAEKKEVKVWVNTKSGVYHCPGSRWYANTKQGKYMTECDAQKAGYRPAYGSLCGSDCGTKASEPAPPSKETPPAGATAECNDGTYSYSQHRSGTCSHHGGVKRWLTQ
jgi:Protein of unknown function (DUF3761)